MDEPRKPWDQLEGESAAAYARFCAYLGLGPTRSIDAAQALAVGQQKAAKGSKKRASGNWFRDSVEFRWRSRSSAWDAEQFKNINSAGMMTYADFINQYAVVAMGALRKVKPKSFKEISLALKLLSTLIPPQAVDALLGGAAVVAVMPDGAPQKV